MRTTHDVGVSLKVLRMRSGGRQLQLCVCDSRSIMGNKMNAAGWWQSGCVCVLVGVVFIKMAALLCGVLRLSQRARSRSGVIRRYGTQETAWTCHTLSHRALINIRGQDTHSYLQGLITNDVKALKETGHTALYTHLLNVQGRTLYDVIIYR